MRRKCIIFLIFVVGVVGCGRDSGEIKGKNSESDSLAVYFERSYNDSLPVPVKKAYTEKALAIVSKRGNDSVNRGDYFNIANRYYYLNDRENYKKISERIVLLARAKDDSVSLAKGYMYLGDYYRDKFVSDSAYLYYLKSEKIYRLIKYNSGVGHSLVSKGVLQFNERDYTGCERSAFLALTFLRQNKAETINSAGKDIDIYYKCLAYNLLGITYNELKEWDLALKYNLNALRIVNKRDFPEPLKTKISLLNNTGLVYQDKGDHKKAIYYFKLALKMNKNIPTSIILDNLAYSKLKAGDFSNLPEMFMESLRISQRFKLIPGIIVCKSNISEYYLIKKDTNNAIKFAREAYQFSKKNNLLRNALTPLKRLATADSRNASKYAQEYIKISDSLQLAERKIRNKFARIEYETEELVTEKQTLLSRETKIIYTSIAFFLLLSVIVVFGYYILKNRQLKLKHRHQLADEELYQLMLGQNQKIEEGRQMEKKRISKELHDGVMGKLTAIRLNLFALSKQRDAETIAKSIDYINEIQHIEKEIRAIAYDLQSEFLSNDTEFESMIENLVSSFETNVFDYSFDENIDWDSVDNPIKLEVYRIFRQTLRSMEQFQANSTGLSVNGTIKGLEIEIVYCFSDHNDAAAMQDLKEKFSSIGEIEMKSYGKELKIKTKLPNI